MTKSLVLDAIIGIIICIIGIFFLSDFSSQIVSELSANAGNFFLKVLGK